MRHLLRLIIASWLLELVVWVLPHNTKGTIMALQHIDHACRGMLAEIED